MDSSDMVEEDEETFLKGSGQCFSFLQYEEDMSTFDEDEIEGVSTVPFQDNAFRRDTCITAEPMKKDSIGGLSVGRQSPSCPRFYPLDLQNWEDDIVWDDSPVGSDTSAESCEISGSGWESLGENETGSVTEAHNLQLESPVEPDEKNHEIWLHNSSVLLEPFGSRNLSGPSTVELIETRYHPQHLRLQSRFEVDNSNNSDATTEELVGKQLHHSDSVRHFSKLIPRNRDMLEGSWLDRIIWEPDTHVGKQKLIFDLQDEQMVFEILDNKDGKNLKLHAGSMIVSRPAKSSNGDSLEFPGHGGQLGWRSVANDKHYSNRKTSQQMKSSSKRRIAQGIKIYHSQPALTLQTMKLKLSK